MNLNLLARALKERKVGVSIFGLSLFLYAWMLMSLIPVFLKNVQFRGLIAQYPKALLNLAAGASNVDFFTVEGFMTIEFLALWFPIIILGFAVAFATAMVAKEIDEGTIDFLMSQPIPRQNLILSRFFSLILYLIALTTIALGSLYLLAPLYDAKLKIRGILLTGLLALVFFLAISPYTLFLSLILKERGQAIVASVSIFVASHLLNALADFSDTLKKFRFLSMFKYYQPYKTLTTGDVPWRDIAIFLVITVIFLVGSLLVFRRKDITTA